MQQPDLDFTLPIAGNTTMARHASWTGAKAAEATWTARQSAYLQLIHQAGALTDQEAAALLKCQLCSVNSVRNGIEKLRRLAGLDPMFMADGFDTHHYTDASGTERMTRRTRWRLA